MLHFSDILDERLRVKLDAVRSEEHLFAVGDGLGAYSASGVPEDATPPSLKCSTTGDQLRHHILKVHRILNAFIVYVHHAYCNHALTGNIPITL